MRDQMATTKRLALSVLIFWSAIALLGVILDQCGLNVSALMR